MEEKMQKITISVALFVLLVFLAVSSVMSGTLAQTGEEEIKAAQQLQDFDHMVLQSRLEIRQYCALVQTLFKEDDSAKKSKALEHIRQAGLLWEQVRLKYETQPPAAYRADDAFGARMEAIQQGIRDMETQLADSYVKEAFQACSMTCGLFVKLHEENHLVYAADRLFHLRKLAKKIIDEEQKSGLSSVQGMMTDLLKSRDQVLLAPCPAPRDPARCQSYQSALKNLSAQLDELTIYVVNKEPEPAGKILKDLIAVINVAYGIAL